MNCLKHIEDECKSCSKCQEDLRLDLLQALDFITQMIEDEKTLSYIKSDNKSEIMARAHIFLKKFGLNQ